MYTAYDFINNKVQSKNMRFGWMVEIDKSSNIVLKYTMLNFDWRSFQCLSDQLWDSFLSSISYKAYRSRIDKAMMKFKRLYFEALNISNLKIIVNEFGLNVDIDKLIRKTVQKKAEKMKDHISHKCK